MMYCARSCWDTIYFKIQTRMSHLKSNESNCFQKEGKRSEIFHFKCHWINLSNKLFITIENVNLSRRKCHLSWSLLAWEPMLNDFKYESLTKACVNNGICFFQLKPTRYQMLGGELQLLHQLNLRSFGEAHTRLLIK